MVRWSAFACALLLRLALPGSALADRPPFLTVAPWRTVANSLAFAAVAAAIATVVGGWASLVIVYGRRSVSRLVELGYVLPLGTSAVTLGLGVLITFEQLRGIYPGLHFLNTVFKHTGVSVSVVDEPA